MRGDAHAALRAATRAAHDRVDAGFSRYDLTDRAGYGGFLAAHAAIVLPLEQWLDAHAALAIDDWPERRRGAALRADLAALAVDPRAGAPFALAATPGSAAGALYVIEGSRLGGRMLARGVAAGLPTGYLDAPAARGNWPKLLGRLEELLYDTASRSAAIASATAVFDRFEAAARSALWSGEAKEHA